MGFSLSRHFMVPVVLGLLFAAILSAVTLATAIVNHDTPLGLASVIAIVIALLLKVEDKKKGYGLERPNIQK